MGRDGVRLGSVVLQTVLLAVLGLGLGIGLPSRALAAPYRWIDDQGTVHYSQRLDEVPERYRTGTSQLAAATTPADGRSLVAQSSSGLSSTVNPLQMPTGGWLGISLADQPAGPNAPPGVLISDVLPSGPGDRAGFRTGDLLVAIGTIQLQEILAEAQGARVPGSTFVLGALRRLAPGTRLKFDVMRGQERSTLLAELGTPTAEQTLLFGKRERATQQLQQIAVVEQWLAANVSANDLARATASIGPLYRDQNLLLRDIMSTAGESTLRSKLLEAKQDRRLEVLHRLIGVLQTVETRSLPVCCGQADHYREFSRNLQGLLPPKYYFKKTVDSASPFTLGAIRSTLLFIEPYQDAHERLQDVESRLKVSEAALAVNTEFAAVQSQLQANADRGVFRDATLDVRIARLPDSMRTSLRDYEKQLVATAEQRKRDADAAEAERRKQKETMDAGFEQLKASKQREDERRRLEREATEAKARAELDAARQQREQLEQGRAKVLAKFRASHVSSGDDLHDNPFKLQGQAVGVMDIRFKRMIEAGVAVCETRNGQELLVSSLPVDSFSQAGESKSLVVKVIGTQPAKNAMGGPITLTHLEYVAVLP